MAEALRFSLKQGLGKGGGPPFLEELNRSHFTDFSLPEGILGIYFG